VFSNYPLNAFHLEKFTGGSSSGFWLQSIQTLADKAAGTQADYQKD